ncbi:CU044_5270 family protein [Actinoallomurus spadix]|uniref:CU044_5270 family protein n=1 Tax=Actinoallomurus spadix TaxID=79912 RepID=A0ABN0WE92_9ACTN|nr:CU044_5270 family protein [Actinoallomurus spadix]MCO5987240.1 CU044_5270 family protein [Actinoallomurus spadix]
MDEMAQLNLLRAEVPRPAPGDLRTEEDRLLAEIAAPGSARLPRPAHRGRAWPLRIGLSAVATGLAAAAVAGIALSGGDPRAPRASYSPQAVPVAVVQTLDRAADAATRQRELHPRPGQFLVFESENEESVDSNSKEHGHSRYLSRDRRKIWLPVAGRATGGVLIETGLPPRRYGDWPIPPEAGQEAGTSERTIDFDNRAEYLRTDYAYLSRLPADPQGMRAHLYDHLTPGTADGDREAWSRAGAMLTEGYMPAAQRAALFRAAATIPGAQAVGRAEDAAGRKGIAVARVDEGAGERAEYIFDPRTYLLLGRRTVVVDAKKGQAPVGTVVESTAQLKVSVADGAPKVTGG